MKLQTKVLALLMVLGCVVAYTLTAGETLKFEPEKALPEEVIFMAAARSWPEMVQLVKETSYGHLWSDPLLKPFRERFNERMREQLLAPIEREMEIRIEEFTDLWRGTIAFAILPDSTRTPKPTPGWILVIDTREQAGKAQKLLVAQRKKWNASGKPLRTETIAGTEFSILTLATNSQLRSLRRVLPKALDFHELGLVEKATPSAPINLYIGVRDGFMILSGSATLIENVIARLSDSAAPRLGGMAAYDSCHNLLFRSAPVYAWINTKPFIATYAAPPERTSEPPPAPADVLDSSKVVRGLGVTAVRSAGLALSHSREGVLVDLFVDVPSAERQGLFKLMAGEPKDVSIPTWTPHDAVRFQRWRMGGASAWQTFQQMMAEISPQWTSTIDFIIETANQAAQLKEPNFDLRINLLGNIGDDFIRYSKAPVGPAGTPGVSPSILLVSSPNPVQLASALQRVLILLSAGAETPSQREFLGRTIYSVPLPSVPLPFESAPAVPAGRMLHYAASSSFVALSTDASLIEEHLRSPESQGKTLAQRPGLLEAAALVTGPSASLFLYENSSELTRLSYESLRTAGNATNSKPLFSMPVPGFTTAENPIMDWVDVSLLPPFERVSKHFGLMVRGSSANAEGLRWKWFMPTPSSDATLKSR